MPKEPSAPTGNRAASRMATSMEPTSSAPPHTPRETWRRRRLAPMEYVMGKPWLVLRSSQLDPQQFFDGQLDFHVLILEISDEDLDRVDAFFRSVTETIEAESKEGGTREMPLCIALLSSAQAAPALTGGVQQEAGEKLLSAQRKLHDLGLDEVILKGMSAAETHLSVLMALQRLEYAQGSWAFWETNIREEERAEASRLVEEREAELRRQFIDDLWARASELTVAKVLPPLDASVPTKIAVGTEVRELRVDGVLGRGGFCTVCVATNRDTGGREAMKIFPKQRNGSVDGVLGVAAEVDALRKLHHENVVSLIGVVHSHRHILVRMEFAGQMTLMKHLRQREHARLPEARACDLFRQLLAGMAYCHGRGIAHCDIKPENLGMDDEGRHLKILDFGCAAKVDAVVASPRGTMPFIAPEVLLAGGYAPAPVDVWAMGVVLVEMTAGVGSVNRLMQWPASVKATKQAGEEVLAVLGERPGAICEVVREACGASAELTDLLDACLLLDPCGRLSAARLAQLAWAASAPTSDRAPPCASAPCQVREGFAEALPPPRPSGRGPRPSMLRRRRLDAKGDEQAGPAAGA